MNRSVIGIAAAAVGVAGAIVLTRSLRDSTPGERIDRATVASLQRFSDGVTATRESTIAAFAATNESDHEPLDARALADIERLSAIFAEIRSELSSGAVDLASSIVERYEAAQLQLMSFAINRKNREDLGSQHTLEADDRKAFERDSAQLGEKLRDVISNRRI